MRHRVIWEVFVGVVVGGIERIGARREGEAGVCGSRRRCDALDAGEDRPCAGNCLGKLPASWSGESLRLGWIAAG